MINRDDVNRIIEISESYQMPDRLMEILSDTEWMNRVCDDFLKIDDNLGRDWFTEYYQQEHGDRDALKQDFTPDCICKIISGIIGNPKSVGDICAGTGGLTIKAWIENPDAEFYCEEISTRALPVLLFNLAIRKANAIVVNGNTLTRDYKKIYRISSSNGQYGEIEEIDEKIHQVKDCVIMNPPYSLKFDDVDAYGMDERFIGFGVPPKNKADYAFVLHGFNLLEDGGRLVAVLPHGVLFRDGREGEIRKQLIQSGCIEAIIGLPNKLFANTGIPVCLMVLSKRRNSEVLIVDASRDFEKNAKQNDMSDEHVGKLLSVYKNRFSVERYSILATVDEIRENNYNLNIPRYVDTFMPEPVPDLDKCLSELFEIDLEIRDSELRLMELMGDIVGSGSKEEEIMCGINSFKSWTDLKYGDS